MTKEEIIKQLAEITETEPKIEKDSTVFYLSGGEVTIKVREGDVLIAIDRDFSGFYTDLSMYSYDAIEDFAIDVDIDKNNWKKFYLTINTTKAVRYILI